MICELKKKGLSPDEDWTEVWSTIERRVDKEEAEQAVIVAAQELRSLYDGADVATAWSGGKDSIALEVVVTVAGFEVRGPCSVASHIEFPAQLAWVREHAPGGIQLMDRADFDLQWLAEHPQFVNPTGADTQVFTTNVTRWGQHEYVREHAPDVMVMGRRVADGNWFDRSDPYCRSTNSTGMTSYSPIREWPHELTLAVIHYFNRPMPPVYDWPHGWSCGTGPWPGRHGMDDFWGDIMAIDLSVVEDAALHGVAGAEEALSGQSV